MVEPYISPIARVVAVRALPAIVAALAVAGEAVG